jgi:cyclophilin family peptidyl-prolyl cis-trans isomerase
MAQLVKDFPKDVRIAYRHYPLIGTPEQPYHDKAALSTQAAEAAGKQGKFWEMHDLIMARQGEWASLSVSDFQNWLLERAKELKLNELEFSKDLTSEELVNLAQQAWEKGQETGIPGTPFLLVNGHVWPNNVPMDYTNLSAVVQLTLLEQRQYQACPENQLEAGKDYVATIKTEKGDIVLELFADKAPLAVNSFKFLAEKGWFNNITFHRVIPGFVAQAGDPTGTGYGGPGYAFSNEVSPELTFDREGLLAMANAGPDSNGSQFFITYAPQPNLNGNYTIFGQVIAGLDVLMKLTPRDPTQNNALPPGDKIITITIESK